MTLRFDCICGRLLQVPDDLAGRRVRCPACRAIVVAGEPRIPTATLRAKPALAPRKVAWPRCLWLLACAVGLLAAPALAVRLIPAETLARPELAALFMAEGVLLLVAFFRLDMPTARVLLPTWFFLGYPAMIWYCESSNPDRRRCPHADRIFDAAAPR